VPSRATAVKNGSKLELRLVADLGRQLGLDVRRQVKVDRRTFQIIELEGLPRAPKWQE
jgi:hypothetical protein